jgi:hypothetical protein
MGGEIVPVPDWLEQAGVTRIAPTIGLQAIRIMATLFEPLSQ